MATTPARASRSSVLVVCLAAALTAACAEDEAPRTNDGFDVTEAGPFEVGYRRLEATYDPQDGGPMRTVRVSVWYPTEDDIADTSTEGHAYTFIGREMNAFVNAPLRAPAYRDGYPVVVHSHGDWGYSDQNFHVAEGLARHGYVVVAPMHEQNTALDLTMMLDRVATHYRRPMDLRATIDLLESGLPESDPLFGRCVTDRVIVSGHSRGTVAAFALLGAQFDRSYFETQCMAGTYDAGGGCTEAQLARFEANYLDSRVVGAVIANSGGNPDAVVGGIATYQALAAPLLFVNGTEDNSHASVTSLFPSFATPDKTLVVFDGGCHDLPAGGGCTNITNDEAWPPMNSYYRAFSRRWLFDDMGDTVTGLLDGTISLSPKVTVTH